MVAASKEKPHGAAMNAVARPGAVGAVRAQALFREQAVQSYLASMRESEVLRVAPPWARGVLLVATLLVTAAIAGTFVVKVEQTGRGRGVLRVAGGVQGVTSQVTGVVLELGARSGDVVPAGSVLVKIDSTPTKTALLEAERQITRAEADVTSFGARRDREQANRITLLRQRAGLVGRRAQNQRATVIRLKQRLATFDKLVSEGLASSLDRQAVEGEVAAAQAQAIALEEELSNTNLQASSIAAELASELDKLTAEVQKAKDHREAISFQLRQTEVRSPRAGRLEALLAKVGDTVAVGAPVARLVPEGAPRQVVVFLPESDRAFLTEGAIVAVELDQLPAGEFGSLRAKVARIASDLATNAEIGEALGETKLEGPTYRIELELQDGDVVRRLDTLLRPGSLLTARFVLRKRRLATLLFEPLKHFLE